MKPEFTKSEYLPDVVWDLDDFAQNPGNNCLNYLMDQKLKFPNLKVTLFAIPFYETKNDQFKERIKNLNVDTLSPIEALKKLYELKEEALKTE